MIAWSNALGQKIMAGMCSQEGFPPWKTGISKKGLETFQFPL